MSICVAVAGGRRKHDGFEDIDCQAGELDQCELALSHVVVVGLWNEVFEFLLDGDLGVYGISDLMMYCFTTFKI